MFSVAASSLCDPFLPDTDGWVTAPSGRHSHEFDEQWSAVDADLSDSASLSPLPLTSAVNSLYLPHTPDDTDSSSSLPPPSPSHAAFTATSLPPPSPSTVPPSRKRGKADDAERAVRADRKRRRHRAIDLARRQRETAAMQQLSQLIQPADGPPAEDSDDRRDKNTIIEQAVQQLSALQQLVARLTHTNHAQHDQLSAARCQLQQSQSALSYLDDETRSHSAYSSAFLSSSLSLFLVCVNTGIVLDANARLFQSTGWQRHHVVGRLLTAPYTHIVCQSGMTAAERSQRDQQRVLVENAARQMVPAPSPQQYQSSKQAVVDVLSGHSEQVWARWRLYVRSGRLAEVGGSCWAGELEEGGEEVGAGGGGGGEMRRYRRPKQIVFATSFGDAIMVD